MKKIFLSLFALLLGLTLVACGKGEEEVKRTYVADGDYTAFKYDTSHDAPQLTTVTVTIKNDKIAKFYIDVVQSAAVKNNEGAVTGFAFNAESKKEKGYYYGMFNADEIKDDPATADVDESNAGYKKQDLTTETGLSLYKAYLARSGKKEWFMQAALIEKALLEKGVNGVTVAEGEYTNLSGVTISEAGVVALAAEAVANAKAGKVQAVVAVDANVVWATATVNAEGKLSGLLLNTIQGKTTDGKFAWNAKNKQELGYEYGLHNKTDVKFNFTKVTDLTTEAGKTAYKNYLRAAGYLEWFEQAKVITDYVEANGVTGATSAFFNNVSSVTITTEDYLEVLAQLYVNVK